MKKDKISELLAKRLKKMNILTGAVSPAFKAEDIHQFRVGVKRLRALLRLLDTDKKQPEMALSKKLKHLYQIAGAIRDAQVAQYKLARWRVQLPAYSKHLADTIRQQTNIWKKEYDVAFVDKRRNKIAAADVHSLHTTTYRNFYNGRIKGIRKMGEDPDDEQIHTFRKEVKDMLYNADFAKKHWPTAFDLLNKELRRDLKALSQLLGDYNDDRMLLDNLESFYAAGQQQEDSFITLYHNGRIAQQTQKLMLIAALQKFGKYRVG